MDIPLLSGILKRYRNRKFAKKLARRRTLLVLDATVKGLQLDPTNEKFVCRCCNHRMCAKPGFGYLVPIARQMQLDYDMLGVQIAELQR